MLPQIRTYIRSMLSACCSARKLPATKHNKTEHDTSIIQIGEVALDSGKVTFALRCYCSYAELHTNEDHCESANNLRKRLEKNGIEFCN